MHIYACARVIICARFTCTVNLLNITNRLSHRWICHWNVHYRKHGRIENECLCWRSTHWIRNERLNRICFIYRRACERVRRTTHIHDGTVMNDGHTNKIIVFSFFFCSTFGGCECNGASHSNNSLSHCASIPSRFFVFFFVHSLFFPAAILQLLPLVICVIIRACNPFELSSVRSSFAQHNTKCISSVIDALYVNN